MHNGGKKQKYKMNTILVTGGAGFLGRHLCSKLLEVPSNYVICVDNLITGYESNIEEFRLNPNFHFIIHDITKDYAYPKINQIYNLASIASPDKYKLYSVETIMTNFMGTKNMLDLALRDGAKILLTSTSEVYGDPQIHPQPESYFGNVNVVGERSCYDESKRLAETIMYEYRKKYNLDTKIVRIFNTYGPYMDINDGRVITNFIKNIKLNNPIQIYGSGKQTRSFCYCTDMIRGLCLMMETDNSISGPINLGNPDCEFTLDELVKIYSKIYSSNIVVEYLKETENDPKCRKPVIDKAQEILGWIPTIGLEEGLISTIEFFSTI